MSLIQFDKHVEDGLLERNGDGTSHAELDAGTFHAHSIGYCKRQMYLSKFGLNWFEASTQGIFERGENLHENIRDLVEPRMDVDPEMVGWEVPIQPIEIDGITLVGRADVVDTENEVVYDIKSRGNWFRFNPPTQRHLDQLYVYMKAFGYDEAAVVYASRSDHTIKMWPSNRNGFPFDEERFEELVEKAKEVKDVIEETGMPQTADDIPFDKCDDGCFMCSKEILRFDVSHEMASVPTLED